MHTSLNIISIVIHSQSVGETNISKQVVEKNETHLMLIRSRIENTHTVIEATSQKFWSICILYNFVVYDTNINIILSLWSC
jgi:3-deoxy-D-manno-octulosonic-acid transferase